MRQAFTSATVDDSERARWLRWDTSPGLQVRSRIPSMKRVVRVGPGGDRKCRGYVRGSKLGQHGEQGDRGDGDPRDAGNDAQ